LALAYGVIKQGGLRPCVLNAANEAAVGAYLAGAIKFSRIPTVIESVLAKHRNRTEPSLTDILHTDQWAKEQVRKLCQRR
jgi:1-deoxy-D-xylulose-5-phosphate reductoisomerase